MSKIRKQLIAANWKMHKTVAEARDFAADFLRQIDKSEVEIVVCPPFTSLAALQDAFKASSVKIGAQDLFWENKGAFTGEISAPMLLDLDCSYVIVGHSERRGIIGEDNSVINHKLQAAIENGLIPIFCVGESLEERENKQAHQKIECQLKEGLNNINFPAGKLLIAYEPIWAIGTGVTASTDDAQEMIAFIREYLAKLYNREIADETTILYGGSVKPANIAELINTQDIDGALVGGASLNASDFAQIVRLGKDV